MEKLDNTLHLSSGYDRPLLGLDIWNQKDSDAITLALTEIGYRHVDFAS